MNSQNFTVAVLYHGLLDGILSCWSSYFLSSDRKAQKMERNLAIDPIYQSRSSSWLHDDYSKSCSKAEFNGCPIYSLSDPRDRSQIFMVLYIYSTLAVPYTVAYCTSCLVPLKYSTYVHYHAERVEKVLIYFSEPESESGTKLVYCTVHCTINTIHCTSSVHY